MLNWDDHDLLASRALAPFFYKAPHPQAVTPREYQYAAAEYSLGRPSGNSIVGDVPGTGKTIEALLIDNAFREHNPSFKRTLAIVPASLRGNWEREIWLWSDTQNVSTYVTYSSKDGVSDRADWCILSYAMLRNASIFKAVRALNWDHLILDEAHALKDPSGSAKQVVAVTGEGGIHECVGTITMLSGTMMPNRPDEVYNAMRLCDWDSIDQASLESFREYYYDIGEGWVFSPVYDEEKEAYIRKRHWSDEVRNVPTNLDDLQWRLRKRLMVRRLKSEVLPELPPKQWHPFPLALTPAMRHAMKHPGWRHAEALYELDPHAFDKDIPTDGEISTARRLLGEAKAPAVCDYIDQLFLEGIHKIVVSAWHHSVLDYMRERLSKYGLVYMDGRTPPKKKQLAVDRFQAEREIGIILGQMLPLGEGWTLTAAADAVLAEPFWVPGKNDQFLDRVHRYGQEADAVIGHIPVVPNSLDERILSRAIEKDQSIHLAMDYDYG